MATATGGFRAWYEVDSSGKTKIVVAGEVTESGGATAAIARHEAQGPDPRILRLKLSKAPYSGGKFHPQIAVRKSLRYEEPAGEGAFDEVHIESKAGELAVPVGRPPPAPSD
jgi:hypothetical protein